MLKLNNFCIILLAITTLFLVSCSNTFYTESEKTRGVDLKKYKSYAWISPRDTTVDFRKDDRYFSWLIRTNADKELAKKGFKVDTLNPDVVFYFDTHLEEQIRYEQTSPAVYGSVGFGGPGYYAGMSAPIVQGTVTATRYKNGILAVAMIDARTHQKVWSAWTKKEIQPGENLDDDITTAVKYIFQRLYVKHKTD